MSRLHRHGFVRSAGTTLVDDDGPLLLRGVGLGNWLLPEGYMWRFGDDLASPRQIESRFRTLVGDARAGDFWRRFRSTFISERDFAMIARAGFDHVRLPINARGLITERGQLIDSGFDDIERAVAWSERHGLRILLDLHGAPGGQTGTNIDDSANGMPELFMHERHRRNTIDLWCELARRYWDRTAVLGYDLLNEPLPRQWQHRYEDELVALYRDLTAAIRRIDDRHLIMYEGSHWATNWSPLRTRFDPNQALQFHRYWCAPEEASIRDYLHARDELGSPIYMGEGGENTPEWIYAMTRLYERHGIGWNFWTWKKLDTVTSPLSAVRPERWDLIADPAAQPDASTAEAILDEFLVAIAADHCEQRPAVIDALFARPELRLPAWAATQEGVAVKVAGRGLAELPPQLWEHTFGEPYGVDEHPAIDLAAGSRLAFELSAEPSSWRIDADAPETLRGDWNGSQLVIEATAPVRVRSLAVTSTGTVGP